MGGEWAEGYKASCKQNKLVGTCGGLINMMEIAIYDYLYVFISHALVYQQNGEKATLYRISEHLLWPTTHRKLRYDVTDGFSAE